MLWLAAVLSATPGAASAHASATGADPDVFEVWEPVYSSPTPGNNPGNNPGDNPEGGAATITTFLPHGSDGQLSILGPSKVDAETICRFVKRHNASFDIEIARAFLDIGATYGIRGDIAICQAIVETGWFKFADGTAVTPDQHNYCGLGVTRKGVRGAAFDCVADGVRAHLQHLFAYASLDPIPAGEPLLDPRFKMVTRGVATTWYDLSNRWAMNPNYGQQILTLYAQLLETTNPEPIP